jgi:ATP/ADP translocase
MTNLILFLVGFKGERNEIIKRILKYCLIIFTTVFILFGFKMILPISEECKDNTLNKNTIYTNNT